jgi:hypothetical protein
VPDKDGITNAYAAAYTLGGDAYLYFGLDRFASRVVERRPRVLRWPTKQPLPGALSVNDPWCLG